MTLEELAKRRPFAEPPAAPDWTLGCFRRRCITYFDGAEDVTTNVLWLQSHGMTADIRIPERRPDVSAHASLADCPPDVLAALAQADGFIARTGWAGGQMSWSDFVSFQPYTRWPEPARLERVGSSLVEWAPSGAYVEDWRLQAGSEGLAVGLRLLSEAGEDGRERPREGGLVVAGGHALQVIGRRGELPAGRAGPHLEAFGRQAVFDCSIVYGSMRADQFEVELSIDPFLVGSTVDLSRFEAGPDATTLVQRNPAAGGWRQRLWRIDTLLADQARPLATPATEAARRWLAGEWDVLQP